MGYNHERCGRPRTILSVLVCATLIMALLSATPRVVYAAPASSPARLYESLTTAIDTAKGRLLLYMNPGLWRTHLGSGDVTWNIAPGTTAEVQFEYSGGALQGAEILFKPGVHVWVKQGISGTLARVKYDRNGTVIDADLRPDSPNSPDLGKTARLFSHIEFAHSPRGLFLGEPFAASASAVPCDAAFTSCGAHGPLVQRVRFLRADSTTPGLFVSFKHLSRLQFSLSRNGGSPGDYVVVRAPSTVTFDDIDFHLDDGYVRGSLDSLHLIVDEGAIVADPTRIFLQTNSTVDFAAVDFMWASPKTATVSMRDGKIAAALGRSSTFVLATAPRFSQFTTDDGSSASLTGLEVSVNDGDSNRIRIGNGSKLDLRLVTGSLSLGGDNFLNLGSGTAVDARLAAEWTEGRPPNVEGEIGTLRANISGGALNFGDATNLRLDGGTLLGTGLRISTAEIPLITGIIAEFSLRFGLDTKIGVAGGVTVLARSGSVTSDAGQPLAFEKGSVFPIGRVHVDALFNSFTDAPIPNIALSNGTVAMWLERERSGRLVGTSIKVDGSLVVETPAPNGVLNLPVAILDGEMRKDPGQSAVFKGKWSAIIPEKVVYRVTTNFQRNIPDHEAMRIFPVNLDLSLASPLRISPTWITFDQTGVHTVVPLKGVPVRVVIPSGNGEYKERDAPEQGAGNGPSNIRSYQEVARDTFSVVASCTAHAYVKPQEETLDVDATIGFEERSLVLSLQRINGGKALDWDKDGCPLDEILSLVGSVVGFFTAGTGGVVAGAIVGSIGGTKLEEKLHDIISAKLAERVSTFKGEWHVRAL